MSIESIVAEIDAEIALLAQAKQLLSGAATPKKGPGRPRVKPVTAGVPAKKRPGLSAAAKARIAAAQKARWAKLKKAKSRAATAKPEAAK